MKTLQLPFNHRDRQRGSVAILVTVMWTALFGMAVMAVDFGYLYTKKRGLQSAADAALIASMPAFESSGYAAANQRALQVASSNGYATGASTSQSGNTFTVTITKTHPTFFAGIFGMSSKTITATAAGQLTGVTNPSAIHANGGGCAAQFVSGGVMIGGQGRLVINGDVTTTANHIEVAAWSPLCTPATCKITGAAKSPCAVYNDSPGNLGIGSMPGGSTVDPLAGDTLAALAAFCTVGDFSTNLSSIPGGYWGAEVGGCNPLQPNVYCGDASGITVAPPGPGMSICPSFATFISSGPIQINAGGDITLSAYAGPGAVPPNGLIAYSDFNGGGPAINIANGAGNTSFVLNGTIHAPAGLVNIGSNTLTYTQNGSVVGGTVNIAMGPDKLWTFNGPGGLGGPTWRMVR